MNYKQAIVLRSDLEISEGKRIAQACHASLKAYKKSDDEIRRKWENQGAKKVALHGNNLKDLKKRSSEIGVPAAMIKDAGRTQVKPGTITAIGIGPDEESKVDKITGQLELIK